MDAVGFPFARRKYYKTFCTVELQNTFYQLPEPSYAERLRSEAPEHFVFNIKAWQVITHPPTSPTWRRMKKRPPGNLENYGYLKPTLENTQAWNAVLEFALRLGARVVVIQTPPSLKPSETTIKNIDKFFSLMERRGVVIGWEPRGEWNKNIDIIQKIICKHSLVHVVDPFRAVPVVCRSQEILYFRLHGIGGREVNYRYKYTLNDFEKLVTFLKNYPANHIKETYVMFNNIYMAEDARKFREVASKYFDVC